MANNIKVNMSINLWGEDVPVYGLGEVSPKVVCRNNCIVVCPKGDISNSYIVSYNDKGCSDDGVPYYKACVRSIKNANSCGHYTSVWFTPNNFNEAVKEFIDKGGDMVLPAYDFPRMFF